MDMQYVNSLYYGFKHQFRDMDTESLAPCTQNVSIDKINNDHWSQWSVGFVLGVYKHSVPSVQLRKIGSATFRLINILVRPHRHVVLLQPCMQGKERSPQIYRAHRNLRCLIKRR